MFYPGPIQDQCFSNLVDKTTCKGVRDGRYETRFMFNH